MLALRCAMFGLPTRDCRLGVFQYELYVSSPSGLGNLIGDLVFFGRCGMSTVSVGIVSDSTGVAGVPMGGIGFLICRLAFAWRRSRYRVV